MVSFIDEHHEAYGVESICEVLPIAPSTYYVHAERARDPDKLPQRARRDGELAPQIKRVWRDNFEVYGARKVWRQLNRERWAAARCTVERLMRRMGLAGAARGTTIRMTQPDPARPCPRDQVQRDQATPKPEPVHCNGAPPASFYRAIKPPTTFWAASWCRRSQRFNRFDEFLCFKCGFRADSGFLSIGSYQLHLRNAPSTADHSFLAIQTTKGISCVTSSHFLYLC